MRTTESSIVYELAAKYKKGLARAQKELKKGRPKLSASYESDVTLFMKWAYRVEKGWYGFSLGNVPHVWTNVLNEFFEWLEKTRPDFVIHQVKMKLGGIRIYLGTKTDFVIPDETIRSEISQLQNLLRLPPCWPATIRVTRKKRRGNFRKP